MMASRDIPNDFPPAVSLGVVSGAHPKLLVRKEGDQFVFGLDEAFVRSRYELCEDLAQQLFRYSARKHTEHPQWTQEQLLAKVDAALRAKSFSWGLSPAEDAWVLQRLAALMQTGPPPSGATS